MADQYGGGVVLCCEEEDQNLVSNFMRGKRMLLVLFYFISIIPQSQTALENGQASSSQKYAHAVHPDDLVNAFVATMITSNGVLQTLPNSNYLFSVNSENKYFTPAYVESINRKRTILRKSSSSTSRVVKQTSHLSSSKFEPSFSPSGDSSSISLPITKKSSVEYSHSKGKLSMYTKSENSNMLSSLSTTNSLTQVISRTSLIANESRHVIFSPASGATINTSGTVSSFLFINSTNALSSFQINSTTTMRLGSSSTLQTLVPSHTVNISKAISPSQLTQLNTSSFSTSTASRPIKHISSSSLVNDTTMHTIPSINNTHSLSKFLTVSSVLKPSSILCTSYPVQETSPLIDWSSTVSSLETVTQHVPARPATTQIHRYSSSVFVPPTMKPAPELCTQLLEELVTAMNNLTLCITHTMKPLQVCEKCHLQYKKLQEYHKYVFSRDSCWEDFVGDYNAQYQLIPKYYDFNERMWNSFDCNKCSVDVEGKPFDWVPNKQFLLFKEYLTTTLNCIRNYSEGALPYIIPKNRSAAGNISGNPACYNCKSAYLSLQHYFSTMVSPSGSKWCADIVYAVNETRKIWGQVLQCDVLQKDLESVIALTCFFCFMPIIFYVGTKLHSDVKERKHGARLGYESD